MKRIHTLLLALALFATVVGGSARLIARTHSTATPQRMLACAPPHEMPPCY